MAVTYGSAVHSDPQPRIRSYKPRRGRVTFGQQRALDELWGRFGIDTEPVQHLDPQQVFGRKAPLVLEIGFGMGETTVAMAADAPEEDLVAVDVHTPGVGALLAGLEREGLSNVRVATCDAVDLLRDGLGPASLSEVRVFFPDPWPKSRHHKRRLVSPSFLDLVADRLRPGGRLHCATDWAGYAASMLAVIGADPRFELPEGGVSPRPESRPVTRFERQGLSKGHEVFDILAVRAIAGDWN